MQQSSRHSIEICFVSFGMIIGLLRAIDCSNRSIVSQILVGPILQAIIGGGVGCLAGFILLYYNPLGLQRMTH